MVARRVVSVDAEGDAQFDRAFEFLKTRVDLKQANERHPVRDNAVYTTAVVLWMLVYQRMNPDKSLEAAVKKLIDSKPDFLPDNKRVTEGTLSTNTSTYSQARSRMPPKAAEWFAQQVSQSLIDATRPTLGEQRVFTMDGTTITLAPELELQKEFPPASNQYGEGVWPVALLTVCHELSSGAALIPEVGAMYGPNAVSETSLIGRNLQRLPPGSVLLGDSGFGIFSVAHLIASAGHAFVLRMTEQRFGSVTKKAELVESRDHHRVWAHEWRPSAKERKTHPDLPKDGVLKVRLHEIVVNEHLTLLLVTDLPDPSAVLADLYKRRGDVEIDIRNLKVILNTEDIRARSVDTFFKELLASIVSYNLVTQFRCQAAELIQQPPRRMSFKRTWTTFNQFLLSAMFTDAAQWSEKYRTALSYATLDKLPNRPGRRFEREAYPQRPKSNQFKKRKRNSKPPDRQI
jgi:hypothetical protein